MCKLALSSTNFGTTLTTQSVGDYHFASSPGLRLDATKRGESRYFHERTVHADDHETTVATVVSSISLYYGYSYAPSRA